MNLIAKGREIGLTPSQVRAIIKEQRELIRREKLMQEVLDCENIEDLKILLLDWIDKGFIVEKS
jgi:predicted RNA-binding protein with PUA domain